MDVKMETDENEEKPNAKKKPPKESKVAYIF